MKLIDRKCTTQHQVNMAASLSGINYSPSLAKIILDMEIVQGHDKPVWNHSKSGEFTVSSAYQHILDSTQEKSGIQELTQQDRQMLWRQKNSSKNKASLMENMH
ncbi:hypothetical protein Cni_G02642 [Canna indica]|uniref:Uncharacterized protein n=1 Tax=Canna indica TaxID=4628 RepID=A0AAQ3JSD7_9LILI|nr:hypothetical protein Cni_G02642 [Canna indica]